MVRTPLNERCQILFEVQNDRALKGGLPSFGLREMGKTHRPLLKSGTKIFSKGVRLLGALMMCASETLGDEVHIRTGLAE